MTAATPPRCAVPPEGRAAEAAARVAAVVPRLETERLVLRAPRIEDLRLWTEMMCGPGSEGLGGPLSAEAAYSAFCVYAAGWLLHGHGLWSVDRRDDGVLIGFVPLGLEWPDEEPELGWMFAEDARGQGYATEAAAAARDHGATLLAHFVSYIDPFNTGSKAVAARLGARLEPGETLDGAEVWRHVSHHASSRGGAA